jgi:hypothetical protein
MGTYTFGEGYRGDLGNPQFDLTLQFGNMPPGRSGATGSFLIHADSSKHPGYASHGCIVIDIDSRRKLARCHGGIVEVIP